MESSAGWKRRDARCHLLGRSSATQMYGNSSHICEHYKAESQIAASFEKASWAGAVWCRSDTTLKTHELRLAGRMARLGMETPEELRLDDKDHVAVLRAFHSKSDPTNSACGDSSKSAITPANDCCVCVNRFPFKTPPPWRTDYNSLARRQTADHGRFA